MNRKLVCFKVVLLILAEVSFAGSNPVVCSTPDTETVEGVDCGPRCLRYLSRYYDRSVTLEAAYELCGFTDDSNSTNMLKLKQACQKLGLHCFGFKGLSKAIQEEPFKNCSFVTPVKRGKYAHFVVIAKAKNSDMWLWLDPTARSARQVPRAYFAGPQINVFLAVSEAPINPGSARGPTKSLASHRWKISVFALTVLTGLFFLAKKARGARQ